MTSIRPTEQSERLQVLDALRGFALFGILVANLYSFMGYNTYSPAEIVALPLADRSVLFLIDWFVEGKFYGIFSILFGIGFGLQAQRAIDTGTPFNAFWYRRMVVLLCFGITHMYMVWNGDILTLYSLLGMLLPFFLGVSDRALMRWIVALLITPFVIHCVLVVTKDAALWTYLGRVAGELKADWGYAERTLLQLRTSESTREVFLVNVLQAIPRPTSYLLSGRYFQVLGLFLIGLVLARNWVPRVRDGNPTIPLRAVIIGSVGLVASFMYACIKGAIGTPFALSPIGLVQGAVYHVGSTCLALGIAALIYHLWVSGRAKATFANLAILGRMALTNYIFQNVCAVLLFFGYGLALMRQVPFVWLPVVALSILLAQWGLSRLWLSQYRQGPLELVWRKVTYRHA